jgi:uncharacterized repeat protein (TIGR02543 family)
MLRKSRLSLSALTLFALTLAGITGLGVLPASAAPVTATIDFITYTADDTAVSAGATAIDYDVTGGVAAVIPSSVVIDGTTYEITAIGAVAFASEGLTSVSIPAGVVTIGFGAFRDNGLTTVNIPTGVTTIGPQAFGENSLTSVTIPATVTSIGDSAFATNPLTTVNMNGAPPTMTAAGTFGAFSAGIGLNINVLSAHAAAYGLTWQGYTTSTGTRFVVDYDTNGHGTAPSLEIMNSGETATEPTPLTAAGFVFDGWYDAATAGTLWDFTTPVTTDTTLYAYWTEVVEEGPTDTGEEPLEITDTGPSGAALADTGLDVTGTLTGVVILGVLGFALLMIRRRKVGPTG